MPDFIFQDWGLIDYQEALKKQLELVKVLHEDPVHPDYLVFCTHPPIVTTGRQTKPEDIFSWSGEIAEISRGGRATYHGPSQLIIYPVINLKKMRKGRAPQEVRGYLRALEQALVETLKEYNITAQGKTPQHTLESATATDETGVWVGTKKIASLGIAIKNWITYHGAAINIDYDPTAFQGLNPCGFSAATMTSAETLLGQKINRAEFKNKLYIQINKFL